MAGIRTSINLIDNMSRVLDRITGANDKMKNSIESSQNTMNRNTRLTENMSRAEEKLATVGQQYANQARIVERLSKQYQQAIINKGRDSAATEQLEKRLLSAQMAELKLAEATDKAGEAFRRQEDAEKKVGVGIENAINTQQKFNSELNNGSSAANNLVNKIKGFAGVYLGIRGIKKGFDATVMAAAELNQQAAVMQAAFGNADIGKQYFNKLQVFAIDSRKSMEELTDVTKNFMQVTRNTDKLMGLTKAANRLAMRTGNIGSAENLMQEAMRGEFSRLQRSLHLTDSQIAPLEKAVQKGSLDGIIGAFDQALNMAGLTDDIVDAFQNSPLEKFGKMKDNLKMKMGGAGEAALANLEPTLDKINEWFNSDKASKFFGAISAGIAMVVGGAIWLGDTIINNWGMIESILMAISVVYLAYMITQLGVLIPSLWAAIPAILAQGAAWLIVNWPILQIIGMILIFIGLLRNAGVTAEQVTGFIGGVFGALWTTLYNGVAYVWNIFASLAEFFVNLFVDPVYAVEKLFYDLASNVLGFFNGLFNGIVGGLNWVIEKINGTLNSNLGTIEIGVLDDAIARLEKNKPVSDKDMWEAPKMEFKDYATEVGNAYEWGKQLPGKFSAGLSSIEDAIANFGAQEDMWNGMQQDTLGKLDDTGKKIKNSVDKSNEDLKWMRDLAEQEVINRFTTATMAPQISIEFGDVRETADVDGIIEKLEVILEEQINISAEGVHE